MTAAELKVETPEEAADRIIRECLDSRPAAPRPIIAAAIAAERRAADERVKRAVEEEREAIRLLRIEVNCRIAHGANSGGHLEYVQSRLDEIQSASAIRARGADEGKGNPATKWDVPMPGRRLE